MKWLFHPSYFKFRRKICFYKHHSVEQMRKEQKAFLNKFYDFTYEKVKLIFRWKIQNLKSLFSLKDKDLHHACKIYKGICSCESTYVGETKLNVEVRYSEHNQPSGKSKPSKHLIRILTMYLPGQLFALHQKVIEHEKSWSVL